MGIRYYAYAFDAELTQQAVDDPFSILSGDPLADAWGLEPHAAVSAMTGKQVSPERDMLYLDKAWRPLQVITAPAPGDESPSAAYRMFEGQVKQRSWDWDPWVRTILPEEVPAIRDDLCKIRVAQVAAWARTAPGGRDVDEEVSYVLEYLRPAQAFVTALAAAGRGMVYEIH